MHCLTPNAVSSWLRDRRLPEDPCHGGHGLPFHVQFGAPGKHRVMDAFVRRYLDQVVGQGPEEVGAGVDAGAGEMLVHITDWGLYQPSEMLAVQGIRLAEGESRWLIKAPGHVLALAEAEKGVALFGLTALFGWSGCLYAPEQGCILHNWEGAVFDFWTGSERALEAMKGVLREFELGENENGI